MDTRCIATLQFPQNPLNPVTFQIENRSVTLNTLSATDEDDNPCVRLSVISRGTYHFDISALTRPVYEKLQDLVKTGSVAGVISPDHNEVEIRLPFELKGQDFTHRALEVVRDVLTFLEISREIKSVLRTCVVTRTRQVFWKNQWTSETRYLQATHPLLAIKA